MTPLRPRGVRHDSGSTFGRATRRARRRHKASSGGRRGGRATRPCSVPVSSPWVRLVRRPVPLAFLADAQNPPAQIETTGNYLYARSLSYPRDRRWPSAGPLLGLVVHAVSPSPGECGMPARLNRSVTYHALCVTDKLLCPQRALDIAPHGYRPGVWSAERKIERGPGHSASLSLPASLRIAPRSTLFAIIVWFLLSLFVAGGMQLQFVDEGLQ